MNRMTRIKAPTSRGQPITPGRTSAAIVATIENPAVRRTEVPVATATARSTSENVTSDAGKRERVSGGRMGRVTASGAAALVVPVGLLRARPDVGIGFALPWS